MIHVCCETCCQDITCTDDYGNLLGYGQVYIFEGIRFLEPNSGKIVHQNVQRQI